MKSKLYLVALTTYCVWLQIQVNLSNRRQELAREQLREYAVELTCPPVGSRGMYVWMPTNPPDDPIAIMPNR